MEKTKISTRPEVEKFQVASNYEATWKTALYNFIGVTSGVKSQEFIKYRILYFFDFKVGDGNIIYVYTKIKNHGSFNV